MSDSEPYLNSFGLTKKQEIFAQAVITEDNQSNAYRKAYDCEGMTDKSVNEEASRVAGNLKVASRVAELRDRAEKASDVTLERWMREQARIAFFDPLELYNEDGTPKAISDISPEARAAIASIEIESRMHGAGDFAEEFEVKKIKLHSKTSAQESIGRALGAYEKDNKQRGDIIPVIVGSPDWLNDDG